MSGKQENLEVNLLELKASADKLQKAIDTYEKFSENPFKDALEKLDEMNADFITQLYYALDEISRDATDLSSDYKAIAKNAKEVAKTLEKVDHDQAADLKKRTQGVKK